MRLEIVLIKQGAPPHDASSCLQEKESSAVLCRQKTVQTVYSAQAADSYFCLMKSPRPSLAEKAVGKGVFGLSGRIL